MGLEGSLKRQVPVDRNSYPLDIILSPSGDKLFITDSKTALVTCITVDGRIVYQYRDDNLKCVEGMYCDSEDNLFVCDYETNSVQAIGANDQSCGTLLTSSDGVQHPVCIAHRSSDNELIIGCGGPCDFTQLLIYKVAK